MSDFKLLNVSDSTLETPGFQRVTAYVSGHIMDSDVRKSTYRTNITITVIAWAICAIKVLATGGLSPQHRHVINPLNNILKCQNHMQNKQLTDSSSIKMTGFLLLVKLLI